MADGGQKILGTCSSSRMRSHVSVPLAFLMTCVLLCGCVSTTRSPTGVESQPTGAHALPIAATPESTFGGSVFQSCREPSLADLWRKRVGAPAQDLPVGPGDVINVSVPEVEEIQNQKVRVSPQGRIQLPLVGTVSAAGLPESKLHDILVQKLRVYMKEPRVELFVENYRSRGVAIMGAVQKPGFYDMANEQESLQSMIGLAGGLSPSAAQRVIFAPAELGAMVQNSSGAGTFSSGAELETITRTGSEREPSSRSPQPGTSPLPSAVVPALAPAAAVRSIVLNMDVEGDAACLSLPARPGDAMIVPVAGQVMVEGWVQNPGAFAINPGMTILGAVSAAGGPVFSWRVQLIRTNAAGGKTITEYTISRLESGQQRDPQVQSGDVLLLERTVIGAVPYAMYSLFSHFGTGLAFPAY